MKLYVRGRKRVRDWHKLTDMPLESALEVNCFLEASPTIAVTSDGTLLLRCATRTLLLNGNYNLQLELGTEEVMILARILLKKLPLEDALKVLAGVQSPAEEEEAAAA